MNQPPAEFDLIGIAEVAEIFRRTPRTIQRWMKKGRLPRALRPAGPHGEPLWLRGDIALFVKAGDIHAYRRLRQPVK